MPIKSPFFPRTSKLCVSMNWKEWAGYYAVSSYETLHDVEYLAFRNSAGLLDITPLFKYKIVGPGAAAFLSRIMVRNISKLKMGRVTYCCWCEENGKIVDDGTIMRLDENVFLVTSADPCYSWFTRFQRGYNVIINDVSEQIAALALQGPTSREILKNVCAADLDKLKFFGLSKTSIDGFEVIISRTGYTGDLGFELWVNNENAIPLWDALMREGRNYNIRPAGLDALDITRVEAGLILKGVDYYNALHTLIDERKSSPFEISLGWMIDFYRGSFIGQEALLSEKENGSQWSFVGLDIDWPEIELLYASYGLPPEVDSHAWRASIPIYSNKNRRIQIGYATSGTWSPILKKNIALATIQSKYDNIGTKVQIEVTVEHKRHVVTATIQKPQFYNPRRKTFNPKISEIK